MTEPRPNLLIGIASAVFVFFIWSSFIVFSRLGVTSELTPYDVAALRFAVAGLATLPFLWWWWPRHVSWRVSAIMALTGPATLYTLLLYVGLQDATAAYAGVFTNGSLPIFSMIVAVVAIRDYPGPWRMLGAAVLYLGGTMMGLRGLAAGEDPFAMVYFLAASAVLSVYIWGLGYWKISPQNALAVVNVPNMILFLPVWWFYLPSGLADAKIEDIVFQAAFQGLGPGFIAVIAFALSARHLGSNATAGVSAAVPVGVALLAIPVLAETPTAVEWAGIGLVSLGLAILVLRKRSD